MRITWLINTLSEGKGIPNRVVALASELSRLGEDTGIVTCDRALRELPDAVTVRQPKLIGSQKLPFRFVASTNPVFTNVARRSIYRDLKQLNPQVVCVDYTPLDRFANRLKAKLRCKVLYTYHGTADPMMYEGAQRRQRMAARNDIHREAALADCVVAVSEHCKRELADVGIESHVVPNGVDRVFFNPDKVLPNIAKTGPVLVYVGRYTEHKGVLNLLKAFVQVRRQMPEAVLYMFARHESKPYVQVIEDFLRENRLERSVCMFRDIYGEILPYIYTMGDLFVSGALDETFGMTFVEAAACGTPSVAFASKSIPEVVEHERTGLLCEPGDVNGMTTNIIRLLGDTTLRKTFSQNAVTFAQKYDWTAVAQQLQTLLSDLINA